MTETSVFMNNRNQAVRLPKDMSLPDGIRRVEIFQLGTARLITPVGHRWDDFFDGPGVSDDFMQDRSQPPAQERASL